MASTITAYDRLILGTAQWGSRYGVSNTQGMTSGGEVKNILQKALTSGISSLDTAPDYGESESKIGDSDAQDFKIITKIPKLSEYPASIDKVIALRCSFQNSISSLNRKWLHGLLFHDAADLTSDTQGLLLREVNKLKNNGSVKKIGVSVYTGEQIDSVLDMFLPDIVQVPFNILDQRLLHSGHLKKLNALGVEVHVRSVFLQGLFHIPIEKLPNFFKPIEHLLIDVHLAAIRQKMSINQASLTFVRDQPFVDKILVGIESLFHLNDALSDFVVDPGFKYESLGSSDEVFLDPRKWNTKIES
jgi:aryl-alcohol dehydrogenase-like predicted oxidoreductase